MMTLAQQLEKSCIELGLPIDVDFIADIGKGNQVRAVARIRNIGADNGMLVILDFDVVRGCLDQLLEAGYGFSVLNEPSSEDSYDADACRELFREWGWSGPAESIPDWFRAADAVEADPDNE